MDRYVGQAGSHLLDQVQNQIQGVASHLDPKALEHAKVLEHAIQVSGEWPDGDIEGWSLPSRSVLVGGEEPVAYVVGGKSDDAGTDAILDIDRISPELLARLPDPSEWLTGRARPHIAG